MTVNGDAYLFGVPPSFQYGGVQLSVANGTLKLTSSSTSTGADGFGK